MGKKLINDILISKKSIRQIPITLEKKTKRADILKITKATNWQRKPFNPKFMIWLIALVCFTALFFGLSIIFSSATIMITPRLEKITFTNDHYVAKSTSSNDQELVFEVVDVKQTDGLIVAATEEKAVSLKATGKIIIYNNYTTATQRLINNTRFEANDGRIYRITSSVIVPGYKKINGQIIPGSIETTVIADQPGEKYNMKLNDLAGDFKVPGFKGDPRYQNFYARQKEDIVGGYIGQQRIVAEDLRQQTVSDLKNTLKEQLIKELYAIKPDSYLFFADGYVINFSDLPDTMIDKDKVKINLEGRLSGIIFNNAKLSKYLAKKKIANFDELPTEFIPGDNFTLTFKADSSDLAKNSVLDLGFTGEGVIKWVYDTEAIKNDLVGKKETEIKNLVAKYQNSLSGLSVIFRPVWTRYFPDQQNKIKIKELDVLGSGLL